MTETSNSTEIFHKKRSLKSLVNTPFKRLMLIFQILSYFLIVFSPIIGTAIGTVMHLSAKTTLALILGIFIAGEIFFYGSLIFLGKEIVLLIREKLKSWFRRQSSTKSDSNA